MMNETAIYSSGKINIDRNFIKVGNNSYSVPSIGSVSLKVTKFYWASVVALIALFIGVGCFSDTPKNEGAGIFSIFICIIFTVACFGKQYEVLIKNSSGDQPVFTTRDRKVATAIKAAVEEAMISHRPPGAVA
ncbi:DUF6232 family protein [Acetobacter fallax]|uniref:Uncharacterized protein n=1 Tax=Acetobacter fallax TaxID=1737473 RepID=A0ABX0KBD2_9PROT|nr:DUF6232 family protein [Acetobacter fallax]NHO33290.1 hypothetical protein [Acetobacter fallax]NHO36911.1 hypothetical protein [Acetobacter fallax]